ncbi:hypothetical protein ABQE69_05405 [Mycolicibacillus trivialis]
MQTICDPESRERDSWSGRKAYLIGRGVPDDDPDVRECDAGLAYYQVSRVIDRVRGKLSRAGADRLRAQLSEAVAS